MTPGAQKAELKEIERLRALFLQENNFQIRYNACHERGWTDSYVLTLDDLRVGYGSVKGWQDIQDRDAIFEFFVLRPFRKGCSELFRKLAFASGASLIECQSNDRLLSSMVYEFGASIGSDVVLFEDHSVTEYRSADALFRKRKSSDEIFEHKAEPVGDYVVEAGGEVVATGGFLLHYNIPFADLYMEVRPDCRRRGFGAFLIQEVKRECYLAGRVPAARTDVRNIASRATLTKAGLRVCGFMLSAKLDPGRL